VTPLIVAQQFRGLGEQKVWDLCDRAFGKDLPGAIRSWRSIGGTRRRPHGAGGIASRLRDLMKVARCPTGCRPRSWRAAGLRFDWRGAALPAAGQELLDGAAHQPANGWSRRTAP
jgi:hypothetical protein